MTKLLKISASKAFAVDDKEIVAGAGSSGKVDKIDKNLAKFKNIKKLSKAKKFVKARHLKKPTFLNSKINSIFFIKNDFE